MLVNHLDLVILDSVSRRLGILKYLSVNHEVSASELAEQFGVTEDTIKVDVEQLATYGFPNPENNEVNFDVSIDDGWVSYNVNQDVDVDLRLTPFEISAILLVLASLKQKPEMWDQNTVESLKKKLEGALGHDPTIIDVAVDRPLDGSALLVKEGIEKDKQLEFDYLDIDTGDLNHRCVDPVRFFSHDGHYYLLSWDTTVRDTRRFRTDRMRNVSITATDAAQHPDIKFNQADPFGIQDSKKATIKVKENCTWILDYILLDKLGRKLRQDGTYTAIINYFDDEWLIKWAIENRDRITVESPSSIVQAIEDRVTAALVRYGVN